MTLIKYALKYERCDLDELCTFIRQRKLGDGTTETIKRQMPSCASYLPPQLRLKYTACKILCEADYNGRFRFCDLPGELRNRVYEDLLLFADHKIKCFPNILATSKAINKEATSVLYKSNLPCVIFRDEEPHHDPGVFFFGKMISKMTPRCGPSHWRFLFNGACWPAELLHRDHLRLVIRQQGHGWATECLQSLFSYIHCNSTVVKKTTITCSGNSFLTYLWPYLSAGRFEDLLWPIARFCTKFKVQFENCPAGLPEFVQALANKKSDIFQVDISLRAEIMGRSLAYDEILTTMLLHHMPQEHAAYTELKTEFYSKHDSWSTIDIWQREMKEAMDKLDDFLNAREIGVLMRRGERIVGGHSQELAQEFWRFDYARQRLYSGQDLPVGFLKEYKDQSKRLEARCVSEGKHHVHCASHYLV